MNPPIYVPSGRAKEYGDFCVNIYTGCNHGCTYCFAPMVLHKTAEQFGDVRPRPGLLEALQKQLDGSGGAYFGKTIHLCFTCDPYPAPPVDTTITRDVIQMLKAAGCHVQILTKGGKRAERDFDLLDAQDWFGVTWTGYQPYMLDKPQPDEPGAGTPYERLNSLTLAQANGIATWMSCEPVLDVRAVYDALDFGWYVNLFRIGKMNYHPSDINWAEFGHTCVRLARQYGREIYIKADLRAEMEAHHGND